MFNYFVAKDRPKTCETLNLLMTQFYCFHLAQELLTTDLLSDSFPRLHVNMKCPKYICGENHRQVHCSPFNAFAVFNIYGHVSYMTYDVFWVSNVSVTHHV